MPCKEYLTTDEFISRINSLPEVYAIKSDMYGIDLYPTYEDYKLDDREVKWFMTVDPDATSTFQPYDDNFLGWPEKWVDELGREAADELKAHVADLIAAYIETPLGMREAMIDETAKEALRHQLKAALRDKNYGEPYRNGRLDALKTVFNTLNMTADYETAIEGYDYIKMEG